jgi:hypothetical protein
MKDSTSTNKVNDVFLAVEGDWGTYLGFDLELQAYLRTSAELLYAATALGYLSEGELRG